jgi:hypothetical protein
LGASIVEAIGEARLVVVIFSVAANASRHVLDEVGTALDAGAAVIPFRIENSLPTGVFRLHLNRLHWLDALSPPLDAHIDRLIETAKPNLPEAGEGEAEEARPPQQKEKEEEKKKKKNKERGERKGTPPPLARCGGPGCGSGNGGASSVVQRHIQGAATSTATHPVRPTRFDESTGAAHKVPVLIHEGSVPPLIRPLPPSRTLTGHTREIWSVAFSPDGRTLASGSADTTTALGCGERSGSADAHRPY